MTWFFTNMLRNLINRNLRVEPFEGRFNTGTLAYIPLCSTKTTMTYNHEALKCWQAGFPSFCDSLNPNNKRHPCFIHNPKTLNSSAKQWNAYWVCWVKWAGASGQGLVQSASVTVPILGKESFSSSWRLSFRRRLFKARRLIQPGGRGGGGGESR